MYQFFIRNTRSAEGDSWVHELLQLGKVLFVEELLDLIASGLVRVIGDPEFGELLDFFVRHGLFDALGKAKRGKKPTKKN